MRGSWSGVFFASRGAANWRVPPAVAVPEGSGCLVKSKISRYLVGIVECRNTPRCSSLVEYLAIVRALRDGHSRVECCMMMMVMSFLVGVSTNKSCQHLRI